jgi:outer membrane murein-binding lipoprotein Lpp
MSRWTKGLIVVALAAAFAVPATAVAAPPADVMAAQINTLKRQVSGLTLQVNSLKTQMNSVRTQLAVAKQQAAGAAEDAAGAATQVDTLKGQVTKLGQGLLCGTALQIDLFHLTWKVIDVILGGLGAAPIFGVQAPVSDNGACAAIGVNRTPQGVARPALLEQAFKQLAGVAGGQ